MTETNRPTAIVVDDATAIRQSLPALMPALDFIGSYSSAEDLVRSGQRADLIVLDLHLVNSRQKEVRQGIAALRLVASAGHRVCIYTQEERRFVLAACLAAGAAGVASKADPLEPVQEAFLEVAAGGSVIPQPLISVIELLVRRNQLTVLSERQREVLAGRARGLTYAELAAKLYVSESTLRGYWRDTADVVRHHLQEESTPADIEHALGLTPGDLLDIWPGYDAPPGDDKAARSRARRWWSL